MDELRAFLDTKFLEYEQSIGRPSTFHDFVDHLNRATGSKLKYTSVVAWKAGTRGISAEGINELITAFGDTIIEQTGLIKMNPLLRQVFRHWNELDPETQKQFAELVVKEAKQASKSEQKPGAQQFYLPTRA